MSQRKMLAELDRETYVEFLETDYRKRMIAEHGDELGLFGDRIGPALLDDEKEMPELEDFMDNKLGLMMKDNRIL